jgi:hypothetical protein
VVCGDANIAGLAIGLSSITCSSGVCHLQAPEQRRSTTPLRRRRSLLSPREQRISNSGYVLTLAFIVTFGNGLTLLSSTHWVPGRGGTTLPLCLPVPLLPRRSSRRHPRPLHRLSRAGVPRVPRLLRIRRCRPQVTSGTRRQLTVQNALRHHRLLRHLLDTSNQNHGNTATRNSNRREVRAQSLGDLDLAG